MRPQHSRVRRQAGYVLLSVMLLITLMLIFMAVEVPRIAQQVKRAREEELVNRGMEYAKAVKKYRRKMGALPNSVDQLMDTNHMRFLRKRYKDPMTGEDDWKLIHVGEAEIPMPQGQNPGLQGSGNPGLQGGTFTNTPGAKPSPTPSGQTSLLGSTPPGGGQTIGGTGIIGVASTSKNAGIKEFHDSNHYDEWLFVYDPRLEQAAGAAGGGGNAGLIVAAPRAGGSGSSSGGAAGGAGSGGVSGGVQPSPSPGDVSGGVQPSPSPGGTSESPGQPQVSPSPASGTPGNPPPPTGPPSPTPQNPQ